MSPSRDSRAAAELRDALLQQGIDISLRRIERWSEVGIIPRAVRGRPGRGRGSTSTLAAGTVERVQAASAILDERHRPLDEVVLILFVRGFGVELEKLKRAYARVLERFRSFMDEAGLQDDPMSGAEALVRDLASPESRSKTFSLLRRRARQNYGREASDVIAEGAMTNVLLAMNGTPIPPAALSELATVAGWMPFFAERLGNVGPLVDSPLQDELQEAIEVADVETLQEALDGASAQDFVAAREVVATIQMMAHEIVRFTDRAFGSSTAMGFSNFVPGDETETALRVLGCVAVFERLGISDGRDGRDVMSNWAEELPKVRVSNLILDELPLRLCRKLFSGETEPLTAREQEQLVDVVERLKENEHIAETLEVLIGAEEPN